MTSGKAHTGVETRKLTEGEVQGLGGEVPDDVGGVTTPEGEETLVTVGAAEAVGDALVGGSQTALLDLDCHVMVRLRPR